MAGFATTVHLGTHTLQENALESLARAFRRRPGSFGGLQRGFHSVCQRHPLPVLSLLELLRGVCLQRSLTGRDACFLCSNVSMGVGGQLPSGHQFEASCKTESICHRFCQACRSRRAIIGAAARRPRHSPARNDPLLLLLLLSHPISSGAVSLAPTALRHKGRSLAAGCCARFWCHKRAPC